jgi:hypothetical protein
MGQRGGQYCQPSTGSYKVKSPFGPELGNYNSHFGGTVGPVSGVYKLFFEIKILEVTLVVLTPQGDQGYYKDQGLRN